MDRYETIDHHKDMLYELRLWEEIKDEMGHPEEDNNNDLTYGVYWLDDNDEVVEVDWYATDEERFWAVSKINEQLKDEHNE